MFDYNSTLDFLKNLLTTKQGNQSSQFNQGLNFAQSSLGEKGREFNTTAALQKAIADWQKNLEQQQFNAQQGQQGFENNQLVSDKNFSRSPAGLTMDDFLASLGRPSTPAPTTGAPPVSNGYIDTFGKWHAGYA